MAKKKINVAVIGATGFTGLDLVLLLSTHPKVNIRNLCATKQLGKHISYFDKRIKKDLPKITSMDRIIWSNIDLVFLSLPNGEAQKIVKKFYNKHKHLKFIDLSADFRINNLNVYKKTYKIKHKTPELMHDTIYGLSEFVKKNIINYRIIANPGCYPTSIQIPLIPLFKKKLIKNFVTIDSKSGYSGAGRNLEKKFQHKNLYSSTYAYNVKNHRHMVEVEQELKKHTKQLNKFIFNPHLMPTFRGILTCIYVDLKKNSSAKKIILELKRYYKKDKFIRILKLDKQIGSGNVLNTNNCEISVCNTSIKDKVVIFSAIDNLVKGASGQAIQNMNLMYKLSETVGLK